MKTLRQVCELTGVDRHVLQRIGTSKSNKKPLLPPSEIDGSSGYWYYDEDAIEKLWLILLFRELDCTFKQIQEIMDKPGFNQREWFEKQITLLERKKKRLDNMISVAEMIKTTGMLPNEYSDVRDYTVKEYLDNAKNMLEPVSDETRKKLDKVWNDKNFNDEFSTLVSMKKQGAKPEDYKVQMAVKRMKVAFEKIMGQSTQKGFLRFGQLLLADGDIAAKFDDALGDSVSTFIGEAIQQNCN